MLRRSITVRSVDEMMSLIGAMTYCTASIAWVPISISAPAPAVSFAYRQLNGASGEAA